jgi:hypothetical protein
LELKNYCWDVSTIIYQVLKVVVFKYSSRKAYVCIKEKGLCVSIPHYYAQACGNTCFQILHYPDTRTLWAGIQHSREGWDPWIVGMALLFCDTKSQVILSGLEIRLVCTGGHFVGWADTPELVRAQFPLDIQYWLRRLVTAGRFPSKNFPLIEGDFTYPKRLGSKQDGCSGQMILKHGVPWMGMFSVRTIGCYADCL